MLQWPAWRRRKTMMRLNEQGVCERSYRGANHSCCPTERAAKMMQEIALEFATGAAEQRMGSEDISSGPNGRREP